MIVAICTDSKREFEEMSGWVKIYGESHGTDMTARWFPDDKAYIRSCSAGQFAITILAFGDILNQELAVSARKFSDAVQLIWIGEDKRFGVASYRVRAANFLLRPPERKKIEDSLERCMENLSVLKGESVYE